MPELLLDEPGLAACYAAAAQGISVSGERAGLGQLRLAFGTAAAPERAEPHADEPVAEHRGVNIHAKQSVDGRDRRELERLCRYVTRPPVAQGRLTRMPDGSLELTLKHPWKDGTRAVVLEPDDLMVRLVSAVPPPRWHLLRYFGVLSSHSRLRREVVPRPSPDPSAYAPPPATSSRSGSTSMPTPSRLQERGGRGCSGKCSPRIWILAPAAAKALGQLELPLGR